MTRSMGNDWEATTLGAACEINPPRPSLTGLPDDTSVMFVPMAAVDEVTGTVASPEQRTLRDVRTKSYRTFAPSDVIFAKITPCMENGKTAIVPDIATRIGFGSTEFHVLRPRLGVNPAFIWHYLRQEGFRRLAEEQMTGSVGQLRVPAAFLMGFRIELPPKEVQDQLVRVLDAAIASGRSAAKRLVAARRALERFRQALLGAACSGRLTVDWRQANRRSPVDSGPVLSGPALANASGSPNTDELVEVPETWAWWPVEAVTEKVIDYRGRTPPNVGAGPIPHVRTTQIREGRIDWATDRFVTEDVYAKYMTRGIPRPGDVLFTMEAPMGEVGIVDRDTPFSIAQRILLMRPGNRMTCEFLALALRSRPVRRAIEARATGTGVLGVSYKRLRSVLLPVPPLDEQGEITRRIEPLLELADGLQRRIAVASKQVDRSSQAVLARAFRGELSTETRV